MAQMAAKEAVHGVSQSQIVQGRYQARLPMEAVLITKCSAVSLSPPFELELEMVEVVAAAAAAVEWLPERPWRGGRPVLPSLSESESLPLDPV